MFQPVSLFVGLRYAKAAKGNAFISFISFFSIAGIALGLMSLITVTSVMNGFEQSLKNAMLDLVPHVQLKTHSFDNEVTRPLLEKLTKHKMVQRVQPYITSNVILQTNQELLGVRLQGIFDGYENAVSQHITQGQLSELSKSTYQLVLSRYLANKLGVGVGDKIRVMLPEVTSYTPLGRVPMQRLFTVAALYQSSSEADMHLAFADGKSLSRLMKRDGNTSFDISINLTDAFALSSFYASMEQTIGEYERDDWKTQQGALFAAVAMEKRVMSMLLGLIVIVAVFNILSALSMMVREKQGEVAILQTLGFTPNMIGHVFMTQGLYNGVVGTLIGSVLGLLVASNINEVLEGLGLSLLGGAKLPVLFSPIGLFSMAIASVVMSFLATLYPAKKAANVLPAEVLRYE